MRVEAYHEKEGKVVRVPEGFKTLVANLLVASSVHQYHDKKHEMAGNATSLVVVDILRRLGANFWFHGLEKRICARRHGHIRVRSTLMKLT